jgi:arylsulfatase A-like enzyme
MYDPDYDGEWVAYPSYSPTIDYLSPDELNHIRAMYAGSVTFSDKWFGRLLETLESTGLMENTVVILSSDHGFSLGDHGRTGKHSVGHPRQDAWPLYEECAHVPLLVHAPGQAAGKRSGELAQHADILPTLLDYAGIDPGPTATGASWKPVLDGTDTGLREIAVTSSGMNVFPDSASCRVTVTSNDYSLILPTRTQRGELYHLGLDPGQTVNLFERHKGVAVEMHGALMGLLERLGMNPKRLDSWRNIYHDPRMDGFRDGETN